MHCCACVHPYANAVTEPPLVIDSVVGSCIGGSERRVHCIALTRKSWLALSLPSTSWCQTRLKRWGVLLSKQGQVLQSPDSSDSSVHEQRDPATAQHFIVDAFIVFSGTNAITYPSSRHMEQRTNRAHEEGRVHRRSQGCKERHFREQGDCGYRPPYIQEGDSDPWGGGSSFARDAPPRGKCHHAPPCNASARLRLLSLSSPTKATTQFSSAAPHVR